MLGYARSMIEIIVLIMFVRNLARTAEQKGRSKAWGGLGAAGWLGGEVMGGVVGGIAGAESGAIYGLALVGAVIGSVVAYVIVKNLAPVSPPDLGAPFVSEGPGVVNPNYDPKNPYSPPRIE